MRQDEGGQDERGHDTGAGEPAFSYASLPCLGHFADVLDESRYARVPDDWAVGLCDVIDSTGAIAQGRYRAVNFAGAAVIAAVRNALKGVSFGYAFGGDGASVLVAPADRAAVAGVLAATAGWVRAELALDLRTALIPVGALRAAGADLRVARYAASAHADYAMFMGGGLTLADTLMKRGAYALTPTVDGPRPDLTGLACRFEPLAAKDGVVLSLIVVPRPGADRRDLRNALEAVLSVVEASPAAGRPLPPQGPNMRAPWSGLAAEVAAAGPLAGSRMLRRIAVFGRACLAYAVFRLGLPVGGFSPRTYRRHLAANADFRKFDDGLRLTVACPHATADAIEAQLAAARTAGLLRFGLTRQDSAVVTCISPSVMRAGHVHFVDGADGGYARAAQQLKADPA
ncbi:MULTISPECIES: DUF3095 domain-containing protein [Methylobacterium]|jgi:hypothetical protein|uniref:Adenylate cyclase n=1 Tax=Methylobacterium hispanicum TaxID=270350 RepID=A0AAV4ZLD8_9HYPH|nr:DUF3095 domain-containing protein [Methylobacterium hispanicum]GJD89314.1 hypothetical protein BHAOGJBA_2840 [Methylobacterium hispanicum]